MIMLYKMPTRLPALAEMARDLNAKPADIARALGVAQSSVYRWLEHGQGPRPAALALYWLTTWGQNDLSVEQHNRAQAYQGLAESLQRHIGTLETEVHRLSQIGHYGSANDPSQRYAARFGLDDAATVEAMRHQGPRMVESGAPTAQVWQVKR